METYDEIPEISFYLKTADFYGTKLYYMGLQDGKDWICVFLEILKETGNWEASKKEAVRRCLSESDPNFDELKFDSTYPNMINYIHSRVFIDINYLERMQTKDEIISIMVRAKRDGMIDEIIG